MNIPSRFFENEVANLNLSDPKHIKLIEKLGYALSSETRLKILLSLQDSNKTIPQLSQELSLAITSVVYHTDILANAGLIDIVLTPSQKGEVRTCYKVLKDINLKIEKPQQVASIQKQVVYSCPVGSFIDCSTDFDCSFATKDEIFVNRWGSIFINERYQAELIWSNKGFLKYAFPNDFARNHTCEELEISLEICSEAINYDNHYKSDITFWINDIELCTYTCPGDFGDRNGKLNPKWWCDLPSNTQYGELKTLKINSFGVFLNGDLINKKVTIDKLKLDKSNRLTFTLGNKEGVQNEGGFNIFGKHFGDYPQDIILRATVK